MKHRVLMAGLFLLPLAPASAQWQVSAGAGMRHFRMTEHAVDGRRLVREQGWLPGVEAAAERASGDWRTGVRVEHYQGEVDYDGRVQGGSAFATDTGTRQTRLAVEAGRAVSDGIELVGGIEHEWWRRRIFGAGTVAGVTEAFRSWRLLAGVGVDLPGWAVPNGRFTFTLVAARPERLDVRFDHRLFDDARLSTRSAAGARLRLDVRPSAWPGLALGAEFDWLKVRRSKDAALLKDGVAAGTLAQPEHDKRALTFSLRYRF